MMSMFRRLGLGTLAGALIVTVLLAQDAPTQQPVGDQPAVTFKVEVNYVEVDAAVFDRQGQPVAGLKREDFEIFEDGVRQDVSTFTQVDIPIERPEPIPIQAKSVIEPDVVSNARPFDGRLYVIILDDKQTQSFRAPLVKRAASQFVSQYMAANDLAAVLSTSGQSGSTQEFTSNKRLLLRAIDKFMGIKMRSETEERLDAYQRQQGIPGNTSTRIEDPLDMQRGYDARISLETLSHISDWVGSIRGRRKAIVYFSEGIDYNIFDFQKREATTIQEKMREVIAAATRSNVSIYSIDPRGLTSLADETINVSGGFPADPQYNLSLQSFQDSLRLSQDSLRSLSEETGGFAAVNQNDFSGAFAKVVKDNSSYYVLGYYPKNEKRDGRFRRIEVKLKRPGLEVRSRRGYTAPRGKPSTPKTSPNDQTSPPVRELLDSPLPTNGIKLRAVAMPFKGSPPNASVAVVVEADGRSFNFAEKDGKLVNDFEVSTLAIDATGKIRGGDRSLLNFALKPENRARFAETGVRIGTRLQLPPGRYQIRVAARESGSGRLGSLTYDLDVPNLTDGPLTISGIAITSGSGLRTTTAKPDEELKAVLPGPAVAARDFPRGDELAVFAEVYDNDVKSPHVVDITTRVVSEDGRDVFKTSEERQSSELQGKPGGYGHTTRILTKDFAPGIYLLTVEARSRQGKSEPIGRTIPFRIH
jgi:VWFA-related protein